MLDGGKAAYIKQENCKLRNLEHHLDCLLLLSSLKLRHPTRQRRYDNGFISLHTQRQRVPSSTFSRLWLDKTYTSTLAPSSIATIFTHLIAHSTRNCRPRHLHSKHAHLDSKPLPHRLPYSPPPPLQTPILLYNILAYTYDCIASIS